MLLSWTVVRLKLLHPFTISRGSRDEIPVVIVRLSGEGITGVGEASPSVRYGESVDTVIRFLKMVEVTGFPTSSTTESFAAIDALAPGNTAAKAAIDTALHDWIARKSEIPLWKYFGLNRDAIPLSSFTIGLDSLEIIEKKIREAEEYPVLKLKLGGPEDREIVRRVRACTSKPLRVDVNEGWKPDETSIDTALWLEGEGVELIEQPYPAAELQAAARLREHLTIPLIADECFGRFEDLERISSAYDGVNVKLMKCGGPGEAFRIMKRARKMNLKIMIGCMIETSVGISAAAHLSPLADYADLDGNLLVSNDPFFWTGNRDGRIKPGDTPGLGVSMREGIA